MTGLARGATLIVAGMAIIGLIDNLIRLVAEETGLFQFHFLRSCIALPILLVLARLGWLSLTVRRWRWVALRTLFLTASMMLYFSALPVLPIAQVAAGLFTAPIFVLLITVALLRRSVGPIRIAAVCVGFLGVLILLQPAPGAVSGWSLVPVLAGVFYAAANVTLRERCADEPTETMLFAFFAGMALIGLAGMALIAGLGLEGESFVTSGWETPSLRLGWLLVVQAVGSLVAVGMLTRGYQSADTSYLTVFEYSFLIFSAIWAWLLFAEVPGPVQIAGIAMIVAAGAVISLRSGAPVPDRQ